MKLTKTSLFLLAWLGVLLSGCDQLKPLDKTKNFICEFTDHSGRTSLTIKDNKATFGKVEYPYACKPTGNVRWFGAMKDSCDGGYDPKVDTWFLIQFDEVAGTLVETSKSGEKYPTDEYKYLCKKAE